jgi:ABC-2 type transport system permease protein
MFNKQIQFFELLLELTKKEIKARYKTAVLGLLWIIINPIIQMITLGFVFSLLLKFGIKNYYLFLFAGLLPWNFFSLSLNKATPRLVWDRNLVKKAEFPKSTIPLSIVFSHFFHFIISWGIFLVILILAKQYQFFTLSSISRQLVSIFFLLIFTSGISLATSCLNVFYRDISFIVQALTLVWFYITPIIYPLNAVPNKFKFIFYLNPLSFMISFLHQPLINKTTHSIPLKFILGQFVLIGLILIIGILIFKNKKKKFSDWL